jgi:hypothetical protein
LPLATQTPPSTPPPTTATASDLPEYPRLDTEGINDDVVVATIEQLEKTNNRPHLLKELAAAIAGHVHVVETFVAPAPFFLSSEIADTENSSANQSAIISSRLTNFIKRPWTNLAPCPIGKDLIGTHPKRLYFYLSGRPHLPFPDPEPRVSATARIISPSLTSGTDEAEDDAGRRRSEMSPSPALDLEDSAVNFDNGSLSRSESFPNSHMPSGAPTPGLAQSRSSPALERDEHEFTQTANALQQLRRETEQMAKLKALDVKLEISPPEDAMILEDDSDEIIAKRNIEAADVVFGQSDTSLFMRRSAYLLSSPMIVPQRDPEEVPGKPIPFPLTLSTVEDKIESSFAWTELKSPETVELDELENLFESY